MTPKMAKDKVNAPKNESAWSAIWRMDNFMQTESKLGVCGTFPAHAARHLYLTRLEAELCLRMLCESKRAKRRSDGRYFCTVQEATCLTK